MSSWTAGPDKTDATAKAPVGSIWAHTKTGGPYIVTGHGMLQVAFADLDNALCVIYQRKSTPTMCYIRPISEFLDGRFVRLDGERVTR